MKYPFVYWLHIFQYVGHMTPTDNLDTEEPQARLLSFKWFVSQHKNISCIRGLRLIVGWQINLTEEVGSDGDSKDTASSTEDGSRENLDWLNDDGAFVLNAASPFGATEAQLVHIRHLMEAILMADNDCTFKEMRKMVNEQMGSTYEGKAWRKWFQQEGMIIMDQIDGHLEAEGVSEDGDSTQDNYNDESKKSGRETEIKANSLDDDIDAKQDTINGITDGENATDAFETTDEKQSKLSEVDTEISQQNEAKSDLHLTAASPSLLEAEQLDVIRAIMHDLLSEGQVVKAISVFHWIEF